MDTPADKDIQLIAELDRLLSTPSATPNPEWISAMQERFPCFSLPLIMQVRCPGDSSARAAMLERLALTVPDKEALVAGLDMTAAERRHFYPVAETKPTLTTDGVIDTFLERYGSTSPQEEALLEKLIFNPVAEYAGVLEAEEATTDTMPAHPADKQDILIDAFLASAPETGETESAKEAEEKTAPEPTAVKPGLLSESLARIFIKQRRYAKAYEILLNISLNYPEKSIYFADQLRFLQKLIKNSNQKEHIQ